MEVDVICPKCQEKATQTQTQYGLRSACKKCNLWSWGGKPLVCAETHASRRRAHEEFDVLWKGGYMSRTEAYSLLAKKMGMSKKDCHISLFSPELCEKAISISREIYFDIKGGG